MFSWPNLYREIIEKPYISGRRRLKIITGFASAAFVHHVLYSFDDLHIEIILGMAKAQPITIWDHNEYIKLINDTNRLEVYYYIGYPPIHSKAILWGRTLTAGEIAFIGSANFSWNGFKDYQEIMTPTDSDNVRIIFPQKSDLISCTDPAVFKRITVSYQRDQSSNKINTSAVGAAIKGRPFVVLSLISERSGEVPLRSGLNWGQRPGRELNQAYIAIPKKIHYENPGFFPERGEEFTIITDDGESIICVVAQDNDKAIESSQDNSILGKYFRKRLSLPLGALVRTQDLDNYGRRSISIHKIDNETYFMDFDPGRG